MDNSVRETHPTNVSPAFRRSLATKLRSSVFPGSSSSSTAEPRPRGIPIPPRSGPQFPHPLESRPLSSQNTTCTECRTANSGTFDNPWPHISYVWRPEPGNLYRHRDIWCKSCKSKNPMPYNADGPLQCQTQTAGRTELGNNNSIEFGEQPPTSYATIPHNSTDAWTEDQMPPSRLATRSDRPLHTEGLGTVSSLFPFAKKGKRD